MIKKFGKFSKVKFCFEKIYLANVAKDSFNKMPFLGQPFRIFDENSFDNDCLIIVNQNGIVSFLINEYSSTDITKGFFVNILDKGDIFKKFKGEYSLYLYNFLKGFVVNF